MKINKIFFIKPFLGVSKINQGCYVFEVLKQNVRNVFVSVIFLEVEVQMFKYQGISSCDIEGFAHVGFRAPIKP